MEPLDVLLVVQPQILRDGITKILEEESGFTVKYATENIQKLTQLSLSSKSVLVLDLDIPEIKASEILVQQAENSPEAGILAISSEKNPDRVKNIIKAGASGFLFKNRGASVLINAIKSVSEGKEYLCDEAQQIVSGQTHKLTIDGKNIIELTKRELEVLVLICKEMTNREIAEQLNISVRTVDAHRRNLLQKTGAKNTAGMVKYAIKQHIYEP